VNSQAKNSIQNGQSLQLWIIRQPWFLIPHLSCLKSTSLGHSPNTSSDMSETPCSSLSLWHPPIRSVLRDWIRDILSRETQPPKLPSSTLISLPDPSLLIPFIRRPSDEFTSPSETGLSELSQSILSLVLLLLGPGRDSVSDIDFSLSHPSGR